LVIRKEVAFQEFVSTDQDSIPAYLSKDTSSVPCCATKNELRQAIPRCNPNLEAVVRDSFALAPGVKVGCDMHELKRYAAKTTSAFTI
jgi:hypothetical protein